MVSVNATAVNVSWDMLGINISYYTVVYSRMTKDQIRAQLQRRDGEMSVIFPAPVTSGVISNLNANGIYQFQVFATVIVKGSLLDGERSAPFTLSCK